MRRALAGLAVLLGLLAHGPGPTLALVGDLTPALVDEAVAAGTNALANDDFAEEWRVVLPGGEEIVASTPFSRLALAARQAALKGEPLTDRDRQDQLDRGKGRIQLLVTMFGRERTFARFFRPVLMVGTTEVKPSFVQNERTPLRLDDGRYVARNVYVFPLEGLPLRAPVTLVVRSAPPEPKDVLRGPLDLAKFR